MWHLNIDRLKETAGLKRGLDYACMRPYGTIPGEYAE